MDQICFLFRGATMPFCTGHGRSQSAILRDSKAKFSYARGFGPTGPNTFQSRLWSICVMSINVSFDDGQPTREYDNLESAKAGLQEKWPRVVFAWEWRSTGGPGSKIWLDAELDFLGTSNARLGVIANRSDEAPGSHAMISDRRNRV
jgi:hypothetical protein